MAILKDYINELNETIPNCYWKIGVDDGFTGGKDILYSKIYCYENKEQADLNQGELYIHEIEYYYDFSCGDNIYIQIYNEIKNDPYFEGAIDV